MATGKALNGKPYAGNPHVRFDEGEVAPAATPRRGSLLYKYQSIVAAIAAMFATSAAMAAVNNLESYHIRHDYSTGSRIFIGGANCPADFIGNTSADTVAVEGPNGTGSAMHVGNCSGAVFIDGVEVGDSTSLYLNTNAWTVAMSFKSCNVEKGIIFSVGRLNGGGSSGRIAVTVCSSSDPSKLYVQEVYRGSSGSTPVLGNGVTLTGLGNMTNGFHTFVMAYDPSAKTITPYVDGAKKTVLTLTSKTTAKNAIGNILQYCSSPSISNVASGYTRLSTDTNLAFYDLRLYFGAFDDSDATAYAALYPADRMGYPFRPSAYVESGATNAVADARDITTLASYIDTGYTAKKGAEFACDFQFLDCATIQQCVFGMYDEDSGQKNVHYFYINGNKGFSFGRSSENSPTWKAITAQNAADRIRRIAKIDNSDDASDTGSTATILTWADRSTMATASITDKHPIDASRSTYLFATDNQGVAKQFAKARIYSLEADEDGTPALFLAPDMENGEAGFRNIIDGSFHGDGNKNNNPERTLRFYNGVGCAGDYKYEDSTLYAKLYATSAGNGTVSVASGAAAASAEGWVPHGGTLALAAAPASAHYEFDSWTGDTWAIADGYSASDASIEVSTPYAVQLRATFKPAVNAQLTIAADGADAIAWSAADWRDIDDSSVSISAPVDKEVTVVAHKSVTLTLDADVSLSRFIVQADDNCVVAFASNGGSTFYAGEVVVSNGVLKQDIAFGTTPKITVEDGGTMDINGYTPNRSTTFLIKGAGAGNWPYALTSSVATDAKKSIDILELADDATVGGDVQICVGVRDGEGFSPATQTLPLTLNGHTLTKTGTGALLLRRPYSTNEGAIDVQSGTLRVTGWSNANAAYGQSCVSNIALVVREGATAKNELSYILYYKTLGLCGGALTSSSGAFGMSAGETLAGHGTAAKLTTDDGAVATLDGNLAVTTTLATGNTLSFARKAGVETNVTVSVTGTFDTTTGNTITVGEGVIFDIGINRPEATIAVDAAGTLALRLLSYEDTPVVNVSGNPANLIVYKPDGTTDIAGGCTVEYDAEAGTITITPPVPVWTNADGTGSFESVANWDTGVVPADGSSICLSNESDVVIAVSSAHAYDYVTANGGATLSFTGNGSLTAGEIAFSDGTELKTGGVVVPAAFNGTGDLVVETGSGAELSINKASTLTGKLTIKATASFTNTLSAAVNVTNMTVVADTNVVVTLVKGSGGSFYANEVVVACGVLQQGSDTALGNTPKITVQDGGTFDINSKKIRQETPIYIAGAGAGDWPWALASSSGAMASSNYLFDLHLTGDATIGGSQLKIGRSNADSFIYLNGHTLTANSWLTLRNINTMEGTFDIQAGGTFNGSNNINKQTEYRGTTMIVHEGFNYQNQTDREVYVSYLKMYGGEIGYGSTARDFGVWNELHGYGTIKSLVMGEGAKYYPDGEHYLNVTDSISGTLDVDLGGVGSVSSLVPVLSVPASLESAADAALASVPKGWRLKKKNVTGENDAVVVRYSLLKAGLIIVVQ